MGQGAWLDYTNSDSLAFAVIGERVLVSFENNTKNGSKTERFIQRGHEIKFELKRGEGSVCNGNMKVLYKMDYHFGCAPFFVQKKQGDAKLVRTVDTGHKRINRPKIIRGQGAHAHKCVVLYFFNRQIQYNKSIN